MKMNARYSLGLAAAGLLFVVGCPQSLFTITTDFPLDSNLGTFQVQTGQPTQTKGTIGIQSNGNVPSIKNGKLLIDPSKISFTPSGTPKGNVNAQDATNTITVTAKIDVVTAVDTVCDSGESYGPFDVTLDSNNAVTAVDPSEVTLSSNAVDLLNGGTFSICLIVSSTVNGTVQIDALTFKFGV